MTMKVDGGRIANVELYANRTENKSKAKDGKSVIAEGSFDKVTIKNTSREKIEEDIQKTISRDLVKKVYSGDSDNKKVENIKQQLADGTYKIDSAGIADKILMFE